MSVPKEQFCQYCGESLGRFAHSNRFDGPLVCGARECNRDAAEDERAARDERQQEAERDDYGRY